MKLPIYVLMLFNCWLYGQKSLSTRFIQSTPYSWDYFAGMDQFESLYYLKSNALLKQNGETLQSFSDLNKGEISSVSTFNPLKLVVFHKDFNSITLLDNRLAELVSVHFNALSPLRTVSHISYGNDSTIWLFDTNTLQLELFDYNSADIRVRTVPLQSEILALDSDYIYCWVLLENELHCYNYMGSLISKLPNIGFTDLKLWNGILFLKKKNKLFYKPINNDVILALDLPKILLKQFFVTNETLYIYDEEFLHHYQLLNN